MIPGETVKRLTASFDLFHGFNPISCGDHATETTEWKWMSDRPPGSFVLVGHKPQILAPWVSWEDESLQDQKMRPMVHWHGMDSCLAPASTFWILISYLLESHANLLFHATPDTFLGL